MQSQISGCSICIGHILYDIVEMRWRDIMLSARMLIIIEYLRNQKTTSFREIASELDIKERSVRYDIKGINEELLVRGLPQIEKQSKGKLLISNSHIFDELLDNNDIQLSSDERESLIRLYILFNVEKLNIRRLSDELEVSRRSVQNDVDNVMNKLELYEMHLSYDRKFILKESEDNSYLVRMNEIKKYIYLLTKEVDSLNLFENKVMDFLNNIFGEEVIFKLYHWILNRIKRMQWSFSDNSFDWYVANVLTTCLCIMRKYTIPHYESTNDIENSSITEVEEILHLTLTTNQKHLILSYSNYTNKYGELDINLDLILTEDIISRMISMMSDALQVYFLKDTILIKGLLNHVAPLLERIKGNVHVYTMDETVIPESYMYVYEAIQACTKQIPILESITKEELVYLTIHFIGSIQRLRHNSLKKVLLICGLGYGATALLKDSLRNEYQVDVVGSFSAYEVDAYTQWEDVDVVISTSKIVLPVPKAMAVVNAVFTLEDHAKLEKLGLEKKNVLTNYIDIERRLDFLSDKDRNKTLTIIKEELGYKDVNIPQRYSYISDLIGIESIRIVDSISRWKDAVNLSTGILLENKLVTDEYQTTILRGIEESGFYSVTDERFALFHCGNTDSIKLSGMSLLVSKKPIEFGQKKVNVLFSLASKDRKEHIPAIVKLMRMVNTTNFIDALKLCNTATEVLNELYRCEEEIKVS